MNKVFIIHGWTYNLDKWAKLLPLLTENGIEPIMLNVPGLTVASDKVWDIDGYINWLDAQLKGESKPIVIGHSNGGRIALAYAQANPGRLGGIILIDSAGLAHNQLLPRVKLKTLRMLSKLGKPLSAVKPVKNIFYKLIGARDYHDAPPNMKMTMQNMLKADSNIKLEQIAEPVKIIWGREDTITPLKDGQIMEKLLPNVTLNILNDARHAPFYSHPEQVAKLIQEYLET